MVKPFSKERAVIAQGADTLHQALNKIITLISVAVASIMLTCLMLIARS